MRKACLIPLLLGFLLAVFGCSREELVSLRPGEEASRSGAPLPERGASPESRRVLLLYLAGYNSLSSYFTANLDELKSGRIPSSRRSDDVLLVLSHLNSDGFKTGTPAYLCRLTKDPGKDIRIDTLKTWPVNTPMTTGETFSGVLNYVKNTFPAAGYGMLFSSHASGWLPPDYYANPALYKDAHPVGGGGFFAPRHKSIGQEYLVDGSTLVAKEMALDEMAAAIPFKLDYIIFDVCLMGGIEVAYEFRDKVDYLAVSPTETMAYGFDYTTLAERLLGGEVPDVKGVCEDYYARYENGQNGGCSVTMVRTSALEGVADVCRDLFATYYDAIRTIPDVESIQRYDRTHSTKYYYCFYDLKDILSAAGASAADLDRLQRALDQAVVYEAHTPTFLYGTIPLERCCGFSTYLPSRPDGRFSAYAGTAFLDQYFKEHLSWNDATGFIR